VIDAVLNRDRTRISSTRYLYSQTKCFDPERIFIGYLFGRKVIMNDTAIFMVMNYFMKAGAFTSREGQFLNVLAV
jgi:hypothetical protein